MIPCEQRFVGLLDHPAYVRAIRLARGVARAFGQFPPDEELDVSFGPKDRRVRQIERRPTGVLRGPEHVEKDLLVDRGIAHDPPPLPTACLPASNCGLIKAMRSPSAFSVAFAAGSILSKEMKETSTTITSTAGRSPALTCRKLVLSTTTTLGSCRSFQSSWP